MAKKSKSASSRAGAAPASAKSSPAPPADEKEGTTSETPPAPAPRAGDWRDRAPLMVGVLGVAVAAFFVGRVSSGTAPSAPAASAAAPRASSALEEIHDPMAFDLTEDPHSHSGVPLREMDRDIFNVLTSGHLERTRMADYFPDKPYHVRLLGSAAEKRVGLVLVDLNRDGKFDERWELKPGRVNRMVFTDAAAGDRPVTYTLAHGRWMPH